MDIMNTLLWVLQFVVGAMLMLGHQRFMAQIDLGGLPFAKIAQTIELLATEVAPVVRRETARQTT